MTRSAALLVAVCRAASFCKLPAFSLASASARLSAAASRWALSSSCARSCRSHVAAGVGVVCAQTMRW